jgi:signal transduction histidine kinase
MSSRTQPPSSEREQTDESLRVEREKVDDALGEQVVEVEELADAVISLARTRADQVLATARAKTDQQAKPEPGGKAPAAVGVAKQRVLDDQTVERARADADEAVRDERAKQAIALTHNRTETDRDLLTERAESDSSLATRDEFMAVVSHDLMNLLNTIVMYARLVSDEVQLDDHVEQVIKHAQGIQRASTRMQRLIGDLVDVASIEAGVLAVTRELSAPAQVVAEAVGSLQAQAAAKAISLVITTGQPLPLVPLDPARIHQVMVNLITNAIKFTPEAGRVTVHVGRVDDEARIDVTDNGAGIPGDKLEAIFERFVQIKKHDRRGLGLGLYISKCIVEGHGGRIWAQSKVGEGSTVSFSLPLQAAAG